MPAVSRFCRIVLCAAGLFAALPFAARGEDFAGKYFGENLSLEITHGAGGAYGGTIQLGAQQFPLKAHEDGGRLVGTFTSGKDAFEFTATHQGDQMALASGGVTYAMKRIAQQSANPLARPAAASDVPDGYTVVNSTDAGKALSIDRPNANSVRTAMGATFPDLAKYFDGRPVVTGAYEDAKEHKSGGASFSAALKGQAVKGFVSCKLGEKGATVAVVYCRADAPVDEWKKLMTARVAPPAGNGAPANSPQAQISLQDYAFPDGTGSIGLAQGWTTKAPSCLQGFQIKGPAEQVVSVGASFSVSTPDSPLVRNQQQLEANSRQMGMPSPPRPDMLVAPLTGPADAIKNLVPQLSRISQHHGGPGLSVDHLEVQQKTPSNFPNGDAAILKYDVTKTENGKTTQHHAMARVDVAPLTAGGWMLSMVEAAAPKESFDHDLPTMLAMINSLKTNDRVIAQRTQENIATSNQRFAAMQKANAELRAAYDDSNKAWERRELQNSRTNADFDEIIRGYRTVEDTSRGWRTSVDLGKVDEVVNKLNEADPGRYIQIPLKDEMYPLPDQGK